MLVNLGNYKRVSTKDGGEYAGPCLFTGDGADRFRVFPHHPRHKDPVWFCRGSCPTCPGKTSRDGCYRYGYFDEKKTDGVKALPKVKPVKRMTPTIETAKEYAQLLDSETLAYLESRGISERVARRHHLGKRYDKMLTIPNIATINGRPRSYGLKWRWLPQYKPAGTESYRMLPGSMAKSLYNYDVLSRHWKAIVIVEAILDVLMLETLGIPAVAPFGGGGIWGEDWGRFFDCDIIINVADRDPDLTRPDGTLWNPGRTYAEQRALLLAAQAESATRYVRIVSCFPPDSWEDLTAALQGGSNVKEYILWMAKGQ